MKVFFDSNILLYGYAANDPRGDRARELIAPGGAISVQCLNEFAAVAIGKLNMGWSRVSDAVSVLLGLCRPVVPLNLDVHRRGLVLAETYRLSIYDGMIVAAAIEAGCGLLYSEDMHAGLVIDGQLRVVNPFA